MANVLLKGDSGFIGSHMAGLPDEKEQAV